MPKELLPNQIASVSDAAPEKTDETVDKDQQAIIADLQAQADAEAAANKAANEAPVEDVPATEEAADDTKVEGAKTAEAQKYEPNFKFKVLDEEKEFDEWVRGAVKDKDTEAKVRELYEKAHGLDHVKPKLAEERQAREQVEGKLQEFVDEVRETVSWAKKDFGIFLEKIGMTKAEVAQWVLQQAQIEQMPEAERAVYNEVNALKRQMAEMEKANSRLSVSRETEATQARVTELHQVLGNPEIAPLVQEFDKRLGQDGSFMNMVVRHATAEWHQSKRDLSAKEAVDQVLKILNLRAQTPSQAVTPNEPSKTTKVAQPHRPTVLPNLGAGSTSPAAKRVKSVDDIRKMYRDLTSKAG